jgi:hypothetical protein
MIAYECDNAKTINSGNNERAKMKLTCKSNILLAVVGAGILMELSANAATEFSIGYDTAYQGNVAVTGVWGPEDVYLTPFQATYQAGDSLPIGTTNPFYTFCVDISPNLVTPGWWQATTFPSDAHNGNTIPYVTGGIEHAASIYNAFVGGVDISTAQGELNGAALQVAIWQDLYGSAFSFTSDGHDAEYNAVVAQEAVILASSANTSPAYYTSTFWNATDPAVNQDLIGPQFENGVFVPEPAAYTFAASVCALLGFRRFRQVRQSA